MTRPDDPRVISLLVDRLLGEARKAPPAPKTPPAATAKKPPTPKPSSPRNEPKGETVKFMPKKKAAATSKRKTPRQAKPPGVSVSIPADLLGQSGEYLPPLPTPGTPPRDTRSAHGVEALTPCYVCGAPCEPTDGRHGRWRRHDACSRVAQAWQRVRAAAKFYAVPMTDEQARAADLYVPTYADVHPSALYADNDADRRPWSHVSRGELARAAMTARQYIADARIAVPDEWGCCAICGIETSVRWHDRGHRRPDGSRAALCSTCGPVFDRRGKSPKYWDEQRGVIAEAMTGAPPNMGETFPDALRAHAEVGGGDGTAWSHLPAEAVEAFRWARWGRSNGKYAPAEHRAEALARARAREADRAARLTAIEQADPFGFAGAQEGETDG